MITTTHQFFLCKHEIKLLKPEENYLSQKMVIAVASSFIGKEIKPSVVLIILWLNTQQCVLLPCAPPPWPWGRKTVTPVLVNCSRDLHLTHIFLCFSPSHRADCCGMAPPSICRPFSLAGGATWEAGRPFLEQEEGPEAVPSPGGFKSLLIDASVTSEAGSHP